MALIGSQATLKLTENLDAWPAKVISVLTSGDIDDDCTVSARYSGRCFYVLVGIAHEHEHDRTLSLLLHCIKHRGTLRDAIEER